MGREVTTPDAEQALLAAALAVPAERMVCNTLGRGQFAAAYAAAWPSCECQVWSLDLYQHREIERAFSAGQATVECCCAADLPPRVVDFAALAIGQRGDGELARDVLQQAYLRLEEGGTLIVASDNPRDHWLGEQMQRVCAKVSRRAFERGVAYRAVKRGPLKKVKNYVAEFTYRAGDRELHLATRPGVFSHRTVDDGARALIRNSLVTPGQRVLDIGCGSGIVGLAVAAREPSASVSAIDSNARAVACAYDNAARNSLTNLHVALDCDGGTLAAGTFDVALANPPYYSHFRLAALFCRVAAHALRPGGRLIVVTKTPQWYADQLPAFGFALSSVSPSGRYVLVEGSRR